MLIATYIKGVLVAENGISKISAPASQVINNFNCAEKKVSDFKFKSEDITGEITAIEASDGQLITNKLNAVPKIQNGLYVSDTGNDILKIGCYKPL